MDKLVRIMSMKRKCRRWPYGFVMNLLNIAALNGMYVFKNTISLTSAQTKNLHFDFLVACGMQLIESEVQNRAKTCKKNSGIAVAIRSLGFLPDEVETTKPNEEDSQMVLQLSSAMRCSFCERKKDRKSRIACSKCYKPMCNDHRCQKCRQCHWFFLVFSHTTVDCNYDHVYVHWIKTINRLVACSIICFLIESNICDYRENQEIMFLINVFFNFCYYQYYYYYYY